MSRLDRHVGLWTEDDYLALGKTPGRVELFDGSLLVSPVPNLRHQLIAHRLAGSLEATATDLLVLAATNVRLDVDRIAIPDVVVAGADEPGVPLQASGIALICEVLPPGNAVVERVLKMRLYAIARIPWYLLVEQDGDGHVLRLYRLDGAHYVENRVAKAGETLSVAEPFRWQLDPAALR
ncbi:Uma2 family endonuclease [Micromonospora sp. NPDC000089]|uniref:Uma2 family endonuclease n=1 Tax=unclassified Micromonospora TaxID=2617518 RepID=UPI00367E75D8